MKPPPARKTPFKRPIQRSAFRISRFAMRIHLYLIFISTLASVFLSSRYLLKAGLESMPARFGTAFVVGYLVFLILGKIWIRSMKSYEHEESQLYPKLNTKATDDASNWSFDIPFDFSFGDLDDAIAIIVVPILLFFLSLFLFTVGAFLLYELPIFLLEGVFYAVLIGALRKGMLKAEEDEATQLVKATWIPFMFALVIAVGVGALAKSNCPEARTLREAFCSK